MIELSYEGSPKGLMEYIGNEICEFCHGEGVVTTMGYVYNNEPHMAPIEEQVCICKRREDYDE